ncbi:hypothetical protein NPIL_328991 [Nephila pilipes]|uniref:Uncharacterized protein n=1 Tax=Nephila pilipes TaxID=299642 RepID=A0A8X6QCI2_NEPPI|nr:hypothetical protein NPIL_328991 [Nephila pilipes]
MDLKVTFSNNMFKILLLLCLLVIAQAEFPEPAMKKAPNQPEWEFDKLAYPCFTAMLCLYKNETHNKLSECMPASITEKVKKRCFDFFNLDGPEAEKFTTIYEVHEVMYCSETKEIRREIFDNMVIEVREFMAGGCLRTDTPEFCASWEDIVGCFIETSENMEANGMCDVEEFDNA